MSLRSTSSLTTLQSTIFCYTAFVPGWRNLLLNSLGPEWPSPPHKGRCLISFICLDFNGKYSGCSCTSCWFHVNQNQLGKKIFVVFLYCVKSGRGRFDMSVFIKNCRCWKEMHFTFKLLALKTQNIQFWDICVESFSVKPSPGPQRVQNQVLCLCRWFQVVTVRTRNRSLGTLGTCENLWPSNFLPSQLQV